MNTKHTTQITVRGYHIDFFQHVNNARYLEFLEEARWRYFDDRGLTALFAQEAEGMAVVNININYRRAAFINDTLTITTVINEVRERNALIGQNIVNQKGEHIADAQIVFVAVDMRRQKAIPFSDDLRQKLRQLAQQDAGDEK